MQRMTSKAAFLKDCNVGRKRFFSRVNEEVAGQSKKLTPGLQLKIKPASKNNYDKKKTASTDFAKK